MKNFILNNNEIENIFRSQQLNYDSPYSLNEIILRTKELNSIITEIDNSESIAVIGNSGKLLEQNYGELIDKHDYVIRCNLAVTKGFEKHVGSKTDFRMIAGKSFWRDLSENFSSYDNNFLTDLQEEHFLIKAKPMYPAIQGIIKNFNTKSYVHFLNQSLIDGIEKKTNLKDISTGFCATSLAIMLSNNVSLFGFGFFEEDWKSQHYFEEIKPYDRGHSFSDEKTYITFLSTQNIVRIY